MTYIPFRKHICKILKKLLSIVEENDIEYHPAISSSEGRHGVVSVMGKKTGSVKKSGSVLLVARGVEERLKKLNIH